MKKAYIIAAHKYPDLLYRLIERLDDGQSTFFVHIDVAIDIHVFRGLDRFGQKVRLVKRVRSNWATMGQVRSTLNALQEIVETGEPFEMVHFLSGQDYPIKSNQEIDHFFKTSDKSIFLEYFLIPDFVKWHNGGTWRVQKYFIGMKRHQLLLSKAANLLATYLPFARRKLPAGMKPYAGSAWFSMDLNAVQYILKFLKAHPEYRSFQQYSFSPDELFYLMILVNSPDSTITSKIQNNNKRFILWKTIRSANPELLTAENFDEIKNSDCLFARKFDPLVDSKVLDMIDKELLFK